MHDDPNCDVRLVTTWDWLRWRYAVLAFLSLALLAPCAAQPPKGDPRVALPDKLVGKAGLPIPVVLDTDADAIAWYVPDPGMAVIDGGFFNGDPRRAILIGQKGTYRLVVFTSKANKARVSEVPVYIDSEPTPGPGPGPQPPGPGPLPDPGLRVLVVYETAELSKLPPAQLAAMQAAEVRDYLNAKCVKAGSTAEWRIWDKDVNTQNESPVWQKAFARPRQSLPWILISTGQSGYEGPLPANVQDMMALLRKYGG